MGNQEVSNFVTSHWYKQYQNLFYGPSNGLAGPERKRKLNRFHSRRHWQLGSVPILPRFRKRNRFHFRSGVAGQ